MSAQTGLDILAAAAGRGGDVSTWVWAEVTDDSPLRIQLDNETDPLGLTPDTLVGGLNVGDRVWVQLVTNDDASRRHRRVIILGKAAGLAADSVANSQLANMAANTFKGRRTSTGAPEDLTVVQASELLTLPNVVAQRFVHGSTYSTTSTSYADMGSGVSISITKRHASTKLIVRVDGTWFFADGSAGTGGGGTLAVSVNSTDYPLVVQNKTVPTNTRVGFSGADSISGLSATSYTVQARWKAQTSGKAVQVNTTDDTITLTAMEVWS